MPEPHDFPMRHYVRHVHLVGIGGAGMGGIAEVLINLGYTVSGSDMQDSTMVRHLVSLGATVSHSHDAAQLGDCDVVVYSSAIPADNLELQEAGRRRIPMVRRAEMLAELMRFSQGIAVAGTHGKTTTTSLLVSILAQAGLDPTYVIGGLLNSAGSHARLGRGDFFIAEADESDTSFLHLTPVLTIVTSVDTDHLDNYQRSYELLCEQFLDFIHRLPFYGLVVACTDDAGVRRILPKIGRPVLSYGLQQDSDYYGQIVQQQGTYSRMRISKRQQGDWLQVEVGLPGRHNMQNVLAAIAVADVLGVQTDCITKALRGFSGIARRCEVKGTLRIKGQSCLLIDDYAHHPTEIAAMIEAVRTAWPRRRLVVLYQPHRPSRLQQLFDDFSAVLAQVDVLLLFEVYAAGEQPIAGANGRALCQAVRLRGKNTAVFVPDDTALYEVLEGLCQVEDILLVLGAGDIGTLPEKLLQRYAE